jgi:hypothetical protein
MYRRTRTAEDVAEDTINNEIGPNEWDALDSYEQTLAIKCAKAGMDEMTKP